MGCSKSPLALDALRDVYALAIHNIKLARERQGSWLPSYPVIKFYVGDKVLITKYDIAYHVVCVIGCKLELMNEIGKIYTVNAQDINYTYHFEKLVKCLPDEKAPGYAAKYQAHLQHLEDLNCSYNPNILLHLRGNIVGPT